VTIADHEPYVYLGSGYFYNPYASVAEGNAGTSSADFTVFLSGAYDLPVTVAYATADGAATTGTDYAAASGTLTFAPGETSKHLAVAVRGHRLGEPDETFAVNISTPDSYAQVVYGTGVATIVDDEPHITVADSYLSGTTFTFVASLSAAPAAGEVVMVNFATQDETAVAGVDYVAASGTLTFAAGETSKAITVDVLDATVTDKYFAVQLSGATSNAFLATGSAYGYWYYDPGYGWYDPGYYGYGWYNYGYYYY
jgi:large repetitive protein